ncbi:unnamed protein product [[Actinomadura] parvosata subsp. kistnae]|uniref:Uncharacterized protein n=2 Tax=Nonomuraea TaxID=83681 RepID=A0A1U9ZX09_9ACTN|nr:hypothetical protein BKM31_14385 [Nonomuraea sp. ATCC 55076]SPL88736.1 unnamed protein product [Actinomadura parvosata subsp. kistnae]
MIDTTQPIHDYFTDEEIRPVLEMSRRQFADARKQEYKIMDDRVQAALNNINDSDDYVKIVWRVQQENSQDKRYFDAEYLARGITNLKLFYSLEVIDGKNLHSLSKTLDVFWHAHQNFSFEYMRFCDKVFGPNQFLHHLPTDKRDRAVQEAMERRYDYTRAVLGKIYAVDETFWGSDIIICCSYDSATADGFVFWRPALMAIEPACDLYHDSLNNELKKKVNFVIDGFSALNG